MSTTSVWVGVPMMSKITDSWSMRMPGVCGRVRGECA
jgi:hypothetical protein